MNERWSSNTLNSILIGAFLSLALQSISTLWLLRLQHSQGDVAQPALVSFVVTAGVGFFIFARRLKPSHVLGAALIYFPAMFALFFFEALYLDARLYGNTF
jgi:drug/metabolite transporter (DMT)-like permease